MHPKTPEILRAAAQSLAKHTDTFSCDAVAVQVSAHTGQYCSSMRPDAHPISDFYHRYTVAQNAGKKPIWWGLTPSEAEPEAYISASYPSGRRAMHNAYRQARIDALNSAADAAEKILKEQA